MLHTIIDSIRAHFTVLMNDKFQIKLESFPVENPPKPEFGDLALSFCMGLAKQMKKAPRQIAQDVLDACGEIPGVQSMKIEGPGYINIFLDRTLLLSAALKNENAAAKENTGKIIVEHTAINPNKAAHIGHLRNAILGDTLVRMLRFLGENVEVQNYIDDLGVQVADVIVGFQEIEKKTLDDVAAITEPFDLVCWDLYAKVGTWYNQDESRLQFRKNALLSIEHGQGDTADLARHVADRIVRCHLQTMNRLKIQYDILPRESSIIQLHFWATAFELFKKSGAMYLQEEGKNKGCWVMKTEEKTGSDDPAMQEKVIVRSNGTVTYVGKDMAFQLWKVGKLGLDFNYKTYHRYANGHTVWESCVENGDSQHPPFGTGKRVYNLIDVRQTYTQNVVVQGLRVLGFEEEATQSIHFAYEMVALTPRCAEQLGFALSDDDKARPFVEMSGRKGIGVKADELINILIERALTEVQNRHEEIAVEEQQKIAESIAIGALRYFLLKFGENKVIAFDIDDALSFEGETGPYLLNAMVRSYSILRKLDENGIAYHTMLDDYADVAARANELDLEQWDLLFALLRIPMIVAEGVRQQNISSVAKYAFSLAQRFHSFYHHNPIFREEDEDLRSNRLMIVLLFIREMKSLLNLMGIQVPEKM